jgi:hypothetical protein
MNDPQQKKQVTMAIIVSFTLPLVFQILSVTIYPPDFTGEYPIYSADGILLLQLAGAFVLLGLTIIGMKAEEEKQILAAAGFTAQAISLGLAAAGLFEITTVSSMESYEKFYYLTVSSNFLYFPSLLLIATYNKFKKWIRLSGFIASVPLLISSLLFIFRYRDFKILEEISNTGYLMVFIVYLLWSVNVYQNYRKEVSATPEG